MQRHLSVIALLTLVAATEPACRKKQVAIPAPPPPSPTATAPAQGSASPATMPSATTPANEPQPTQATPPQQELYQKNKPPQPLQPAHSSRRTSKPANPAPAGAAPAAAPSPSQPANPSPPPSDPPRLGDLLTPDQQRQYNTEIDQSLQHAEASLNSIGNRQLSKEQRDRAGEVRTFIQQAQSTRASNLPGAKSLAERAEVLARDLAASLR